jgi:hypothetical protein
MFYISYLLLSGKIFSCKYIAIHIFVHTRNSINRILLENLAVSVSEYNFRLFWNVNFRRQALHRPLQGQINPVHNLMAYFFKICFNTTFQHAYSFQAVPLLHILQPKFCTSFCISHLYHAFYIPCSSHTHSYLKQIRLLRKSFSHRIYSKPTDLLQMKGVPVAFTDSGTEYFNLTNHV